MTDKERKVVPREPTETMLDAALAHDNAAKRFGYPGEYEGIWQAMYDAAPVLATAPAEPAVTLAELNLLRESFESLKRIQTSNDDLSRRLAEPPKDGEVAALIDRIVNITTDWNGARMVDGEEPRIIPTCGELRKLAEALTRLSAPWSDETVREFAKCRADLCAANAEIARLSAPVPELAEGDRHVLIHALTGSGDGHVYRNYYNALSGHASIPGIKRLIAAGLMKEGSPGYFHCTEAGAKAVGLHLPNEKPTAAPVPDEEPK